ncbi:Ig heavy chain Mem5-like precursor [Gallus gallus]|uniref:Ig heavy chain Mem5-like precursor n=1 Tax=Gallus gallus TaxID=9031 RepID=UPI0003517247|nr:Ig heavy chain Mem5-like precursor [Gallus gallus]AGO01428.1 T cell receptor alpha [Gallus gallus]|eukprot:NP_001305940.1 Ig heavy chain Mem5-like precursor [Gallus gallus]
MDFVSLLLLFFSAVAVSRAQVQQDPSAETSEGTGINITCSHPSIQSYDYIYWYRQFPGRGPAFLVSAFQGSKEVPDPEGRLWVSADRRSSALWLAQPRLGDVAVYYCAVGQRSNWKFTFGSGTQLMVKPDITPSPSVYRLTSEDDKDLEMCLITDYSPEKLDLSSVDSKTETVVEVATSENKHEASYLSTYWAKKDEMQCGAKHEGFGILKGDDPEAGASTVCITGMSLLFKTDENLNMLTFSQLGLKIIFMKAVIFNVLITMLMWKKNQ